MRFGVVVLAAIVWTGAVQAQTAATTVVPLPESIPAAPGDIPLQNPAPADVSAPLDSTTTTPETTVSQPTVLPAAVPTEAPVLLAPRRVQTGCSLRDYGAPVERGPIAGSIYNTCTGFSLNKPNFLLPLSYSERYPGDESEVVFQFSGKASLWDFGPGIVYFSYSQRSYFQIFNEKKSKAFRESNYNPELFVRLPKFFEVLPNWSFDLGLEHESNGKDLPDSRSYNRLYIAPYWLRGRNALQVKAWWRIPESKDRDANDPQRDDNPDLGNYYGYTELHYRRDIEWRNSLMDLMVRGNINTGRGAIQTDFSTDISSVGSVFVRIFHGYGESLIDYNRSVSRIGVGLALHR